MSNYMKENAPGSATNQIQYPISSENQQSQPEECPPCVLTDEALNLLQLHLMAAVLPSDFSQSIPVFHDNSNTHQKKGNEGLSAGFVGERGLQSSEAVVGNLAMEGNSKQTEELQVNHSQLNTYNRQQQLQQNPQSYDIYLQNFTKNILKLTEAKNIQEEQQTITGESLVAPLVQSQDKDKVYDSKINPIRLSKQQTYEGTKGQQPFVSKLLSKYLRLISSQKHQNRNIQTPQPHIATITLKPLKQFKQIVTNIKKHVQQQPVFFNASLIPNQNEIKSTNNQQKPEKMLETTKTTEEKPHINKQSFGCFQKQSSKKKAIVVIQINSDDQQPPQNKKVIPSQPAKSQKQAVNPKQPVVKNMKFPTFNNAEQQQKEIKLQPKTTKKQRTVTHKVNDAKLIQQIKQKLKKQRQLKSTPAPPPPPPAPYIHINTTHKPQAVNRPQTNSKPQIQTKPQISNRPPQIIQKPEQQKNYYKKPEQYHLIMSQPLKPSIPLFSPYKQPEKPFTFTNINDSVHIQKNLNQEKVLIQRLKEKLLQPKEGTFRQNVNKYVQLSKSKQQKEPISIIPQKNQQKQQRLTQVKFTIDVQFLNQNQIERKYIANHHNKVSSQFISGPKRSNKNTEQILKSNTTVKLPIKPINRQNQAINLRNSESQSQLSVPQSLKGKQSQKKSDYNSFINRRTVNQQRIDLGVLSLDEVVEHAYNRGIISQQLFAEFVSVSTLEKITQFLKLFTKGKIAEWDFNRIKFTIMDHRRLSQFLVRTSPKDFKICTPLSLNRQISLFLKNMYELPSKDYDSMLKITDSISKLKFWQTLTIKYRHLSGMPVPVLEPSRSLTDSKARTESEHSRSNSRKDMPPKQANFEPVRREAGVSNKPRRL